jgi:hypothetical protein
VRSLLSDPALWLSVYLMGAFVTGTIVSVDERIRCERMKVETPNTCPHGNEGFLGMWAGVAWPLYGAHQAVYHWRTQ